MDIVGPLLIFCSRLLDVPLGTFRILLLVRGKKVQASITAFFESAIYLIALGYILKSGISEPEQIIAYAGGYAAGNFLGVTLEEKFLSSFVLIEIINNCRHGGSLPTGPAVEKRRLRHHRPLWLGQRG